MAWRHPGDKPLSESMVWLPTYICVARPQWINIDDISISEESSTNFLDISMENKLNYRNILVMYPTSYKER